MLPKVILHTATSLDGRITNFPADLELYYGLAAQWNPDAILFGSETVLAAVRADPSLEVPPGARGDVHSAKRRKKRSPSPAGYC
jgi:2,5-diamino-6-(ribosylamino)-4(3H)-pyrimidinone 5'-phosphate reductase